MSLNEKTLRQWLERWNNGGSPYPPGTEIEFVESPKYKNEMSCNIGLVHSHRFAFYFWSTFSKQYSERKMTSSLSKPLFVSIDYHNDVGRENELNKTELEEINKSNDLWLSLYCWLRLPLNNDGQILPALYLNYFSDAYILLKRESHNFNYMDISDKNNKTHSIKYFEEPNELIGELEKFSDHPIYLDIDLDYFVTKDSADYPGGKLVPIDDIKRILSLREPLMKILHPSLVGLTIALEPEYCRGMKNSLQVLSILNEEFFSGSLFTGKCKWNI